MAMSLLAQTIDQLSREKGVDPEIIIAALEDAMVVAARKYYKAGEDLRAQFDRTTGNINIYGVKRVAEAVTVSVWFSPPELMPVRNTVRAPESSAIVRLANPARVGGMFGVTPFVVVNAISEE